MFAKGSGALLSDLSHSSTGFGRQPGARGKHPLLRQQVGQTPGGDQHVSTALHFPNTSVAESLHTSSTREHIGNGHCIGRGKPAAVGLFVIHIIRIQLIHLC